MIYPCNNCYRIMNKMKVKAETRREVFDKESHKFKEIWSRLKVYFCPRCGNVQAYQKGADE